MSPKLGLWIVGTLALSLVSGSSADEPGGVSSGPGNDPASPNIVYIMADDLGYADLSSYGRVDYRTPHLDALAAQGTRFTNAYAIAPLCTPTRVGLMTGRYPARSRTGLHEPLTGWWYDHDNGLSADVPTLSMLLKEAGYSTGLFGKWHLGWLPEHQPATHGFDVSFGPLSGAIDYISHEDQDLGHDLYLNGEEVWREGYITDHFTEEALAFLRRTPEPFFLSLQYTAPHWPWQTRDSEPVSLESDWQAEGGSPEIYAEMVRELDDGVGRLLEALDDLEYTNHTIVIFTSDNGGEIWSDMGPLRGMKAELWEGGIRVPAFVRWPGVIPPATTSDQVATTLDWTATMLAAAGVATPSDIDGMDLLPHLRGEASERERAVFWRSHQRSRHKAVRSGRWKYLKIDPRGEGDRDLAGEYLFDLETDPSERNDLKGKQPEIFERLRTLYAEWEAEMLEPVPLPDPFRVHPESALETGP